ncbi:hypothetical protein [Brevundimonas sp.]
MWWVYADYFLQLLIHALAWCLAVALTFGLTAVVIHLVMRPAFGAKR